MKDPVRFNPLKYQGKNKVLRGISYINTIDTGSWLKYPCCATTREAGPPDDAGLWKGGGLDISNLGVRIVRSR